MRNRIEWAFVIALLLFCIIGFYGALNSMSRCEQRGGHYSQGTCFAKGVTIQYE